MTNAQRPSHLRALVWGAIAFFTLAIGSWAIVFLGERNGVMKFGGRSLTVIIRAEEPERFEQWATFFNVAAVVWIGLGFAALAIALAWKKRKS
ncbi:MAG: hypothetical protein Q7T62_02195 [Undibacterium sp.]|nr:hypothetical protein [Undibacterium sp.]